MTTPQQILVVEDHPIFRQGVVDLLSVEPDFQVVGAVGDAASALDLLEQVSPTLMIVDISLPDSNGFELVQAAKERFPLLFIVALSTHTKQNYVLRMLQAGATGYITKESAPDKLVEGIRAVGSGAMYIDGQLQQGMTDSLLRDVRNEPAPMKLTRREQEVLSLLVEGRNTKEIAELLDISPKTVEVHRTNLMKKLNLKNTIDLVRYALREGIIKADQWPFQD